MPTKNPTGTTPALNVRKVRTLNEVSRAEAPSIQLAASPQQAGTTQNMEKQTSARARTTSPRRAGRVGQKAVGDCKGSAKAIQTASSPAVRSTQGSSAMAM